MFRFPIFGNKIKAEGSAFTKIAAANDKVAEAKGRITAIDAANKAKHDEAASLEKEVSRVHTESAQVHQRFDSILSKL